MSRLVAGLVFSTLAFAASTFYLSYQLGVERDKNLRVGGTTAPPAQRATADSPAAPGSEAPAAIAIAPEELHQILSLLAEQAAQGMQRLSDCHRDPACEVSSMTGNSPDDWIAVALGPERHAHYRQHRETSGLPR